MRPLRLLTLDPGHPDAARLQARAVQNVHLRCHVYAPLGAGLLSHLDHLMAFNTRRVDPTYWTTDVRAGNDWLDRALREQPGNVAVLAGRSDQTLDRMLACVQAGLHVLAAGPWAITPADLPRLAELYREAELRELVVWPLAVELYNPAVKLLLELAANPDVCGNLVPGCPDNPTVVIEATRPLRMTVAGRSVPCPAWMFNPAQAGDALAASGPLVDLALRLVLPTRPPDPNRDVAGIDATSWPGLLDRQQFAVATGLTDFPPELATQVHDDTLTYPANGTASFTLAQVAVRLSVMTDPESPAGSADTLDVTVRGSQATASSCSKDGSGDVTIVPTTTAGPVYTALVRHCQSLQTKFPGLSVQDVGGRFRLTVPPTNDIRHATLLTEFARYFHSPRQVPIWEKAAPQTIAHITTAAATAARRKQGEM